MTDVTRLLSKPGFPFFRSLKPKNRKDNFYLIFLDPQFDIVWLNQSFCDLYRKDSSFFIGKGIFNLFQDGQLKTAFKQEKHSGLPDYNSGRLNVYLPGLELTLEDCRWSLIPYQNEKRWVTGYFLVILDHQ